MGFLFGGNKKSEAPPPPPPAPAPAPAVSEEGPKEDPKKARRGASSTVLTGSNSLNGTTASTSKTLLGQ